MRALGLVIGPMNGFDRAGVDEEFFSGTTHRSLLLANLGHPAAGAYRDRLPRLAFSEAVTVL